MIVLWPFEKISLFGDWTGPWSSFLALSLKCCWGQVLDQTGQTLIRTGVGLGGRGGGGRRRGQFYRAAPGTWHKVTLLESPLVISRDGPAPMARLNTASSWVSSPGPVVTPRYGDTELGAVRRCGHVGQFRVVRVVPALDRSSEEFWRKCLQLPCSP